VRPDLDHWLPKPTLRVAHTRRSAVSERRLWEAARTITIADVGLLGRLVRWRIPGMPADIQFEQMFRRPPFVVLDGGDGALVSGLVGRIWTLRRDYPALADGQQFREWSRRGTAKVLFANWVEPAEPDRSALCSETRVQALGRQGQVGLAAVRPLVTAFQNLVGTDALEAAVRRAEDSRSGGRRPIETEP
jgi:hypothetical protein